MADSPWKATHLNKKTGIYIRLVEVDGNEVIIDILAGQSARISQELFDRTYCDCSTLKGYADGLDQEESSPRPRKARRKSSGKGRGKGKGQKVAKPKPQLTGGSWFI